MMITDLLSSIKGGGLLEILDFKVMSFHSFEDCFESVTLERDCLALVGDFLYFFYLFLLGLRLDLLNFVFKFLLLRVL
jgi:hypothetical protein